MNVVGYGYLTVETSLQFLEDYLDNFLFSVERDLCCYFGNTNYTMACRSWII